MKLFYFSASIVTAFFLQSAHGSDFSWYGLSFFDRPISKKYKLVFDNDYSLELGNIKKQSSLFDTLNNDIAKFLLGKCDAKTKHALRQTTQNLSKRICIFYDGREDSCGIMNCPIGFKLKTKTPEAWTYEIYAILFPGWYEYAPVPPQLVDVPTREICASMVSGRLRLGGHIPIMDMADYDYEGVKLLTNSLKYQQRIILTFDKSPLFIPQYCIKLLLDALKDGSRVQTLSLYSMTIGDMFVKPLIAFLTNNTTLTELSLEGNTISDDGFTLLAETIGQNTRLKKLDFDNSSNMSMVGKNCLVKAFYHDNAVQEKVEIVKYRNEDTGRMVEHSKMRIYDPVTKRTLYIKKDIPDRASGRTVVLGNSIVLGYEDSLL